MWSTCVHEYYEHINLATVSVAEQVFFSLLKVTWLYERHRSLFIWNNITLLWPSQWPFPDAHPAQPISGTKTRLAFRISNTAVYTGCIIACMQFLLEAFLLRLQISFADISLDCELWAQRCQKLTSLQYLVVLTKFTQWWLSLPMWTRTKLSDCCSFLTHTHTLRTVQQYIVTHFFNVCKDNIIAVSTVTFLIYNTTGNEYFTEPLYILIRLWKPKISQF